MIEIPVRLWGARSTLPTRATPYAAGWDLYASFDSDEGCCIESGQRFLVGCGVALAIPEHMYADVRGRSGLALSGLLAHVGTIDCDYRGEICVMLYAGQNSVRIKHGDRVGQLVFHPYTPDIELVQVDDLPSTHRGIGGFGSTGK